jgi:hypothetical protein
MVLSLFLDASGWAPRCARRALLDPVRAPRRPRNPGPACVGHHLELEALGAVAAHVRELVSGSR